MLNLHKTLFKFSLREINILVEKYFISRNLKYIDVESMSQSLHATYPDYRRRKLKSFTGQVEVAFKSLTNEMRSKNKSGKKATQKKKQEVEEAPSTEQSAIEEINIELKRRKKITKASVSAPPLPFIRGPWQ